MLYWATTAALSPVLLAQALVARARTPLLPEPTGDRTGSGGNGPVLRLLITGDSAAAGVGACHQDDALLGQLIKRLTPAWRLEWHLFARTGATTLSTRRGLQALPAQQFDVALTSLGVNDITSGTTIPRWRSEQGKLRALLRERFQTRLIMVSGLPPVHLFPALPQPLRWHLGRRAKQLDHSLRAAISSEADSVFVPLDMEGDGEMMAEDGFHPGPPVYSEWAERVVRQIDRHLQLE